MDINLKVQSILASVIRIYNLEIRTGSKPKVINEDSILINDGIREGEVHRGFFMDSKCIFTQESNLQCQDTYFKQN